MSIKSYVLRSILFYVSLFTLAALSYAQPPSSTDPSRVPRKVKKEPDDAFKRWIDNDVPGIITDAERRAYLALKTNDERENFIKIFWDRRDPNPDTEENEYREAYYERLAYANENFTSGIPGWKTDRGRIYIKWGKPDSIESHPSGGAYDRPGYQGGGSISTYPFETWFYRHLDGVGDGIEVEFVDPTGTGEYRIARNPEEKNALANTPAGNRVDPLQTARYTREQDLPFVRQLILFDLEKAPPVKFNEIFTPGGGTSGAIDNNPLFIDLRVDYFRQSAERVIAVFTVQVDNRELKFNSDGGVETAKMNVYGKLMSVAGRSAGYFEDAVTTTAASDELINLRERKSVYQKTVALPPGVYKIDVAMTDTDTGNKGIATLGFTVPRYDNTKLSTSSLILASKLRSTNSNDIGAAFVIGSAKVIPNLSGIYKQGQDVGVYMQVYNAGIDQTTLRPAVDVQYVLMKDGKEVLRQAEDWTGLSDSGQRLTLARLLPTDRMPVGDYELKVITKDKVGGQIVENKGKFTIEK